MATAPAPDLAGTAALQSGIAFGAACCGFVAAAAGLAAPPAGGVLTVAVLWACFCLDYVTTRYVSFTIAVLHVLTETPFLLRMP